MKIPPARIGFFVFGLSAFVYLIAHFGVDRIAANIERAGWSLLTIVLIWFVIYLLNAAAWVLSLGENRNGLTFVRIFMLTVSGFVINYVTPFVALGGEPYKVNALTPSLGARKSISAVVLYRMIHLLGHMLILLAGVIAALIVLPLSLPLRITLALSGIAVTAIIVATFLGHRHGVFRILQPLLRKIPFLRKAGGKLESYGEQLREMDEALTAPYHTARPKLLLAIFLEFVSRVCMGFEVYFILHGIGIEVGITGALFLYVLYSIVINLLFFIPLNLGAREGGLALGLGSLALPPLLGVYLGVVMRIREFFWIMLGLLFMLLSGEKKKPAPVGQA